MSGCQNTVSLSHKPAVMWSFTADFSPAPIIFFHFQAHNWQWKYITAGSHKSGSDDGGSDMQIWRSAPRLLASPSSIQCWSILFVFRKKNVKHTIPLASFYGLVLIYNGPTTSESGHSCFSREENRRVFSLLARGVLPPYCIRVRLGYDRAYQGRIN